MYDKAFLTAKLSSMSTLAPNQAIVLSRNSQMEIKAMICTSKLHTVLAACQAPLAIASTTLLSDL